MAETQIGNAIKNVLDNELDFNLSIGQTGVSAKDGIKLLKNLAKDVMTQIKDNNYQADGRTKITLFKTGKSLKETDSQKFGLKHIGDESQPYKLGDFGKRLNSIDDTVNMRKTINNILVRYKDQIGEDYDTYLQYDSNGVRKLQDKEDLKSPGPGQLPELTDLINIQTKLNTNQQLDINEIHKLQRFIVILPKKAPRQPPPTPQQIQNIQKKINIIQQQLQIDGNQLDQKQKGVIINGIIRLQTLTPQEQKDILTDIQPQIDDKKTKNGPITIIDGITDNIDKKSVFADQEGQLDKDIKSYDAKIKAEIKERKDEVTKYSVVINIIKEINTAETKVIGAELELKKLEEKLKVGTKTKEELDEKIKPLQKELDNYDEKSINNIIIKKQLIAGKIDNLITAENDPKKLDELNKQYIKIQNEISELKNKLEKYNNIQALETKKKNLNINNIETEIKNKKNDLKITKDERNEKINELKTLLLSNENILKFIFIAIGKELNEANKMSSLTEDNINEIIKPETLTKIENKIRSLIQK